MATNTAGVSRHAHNFLRGPATQAQPLGCFSSAHLSLQPRALPPKTEMYRTFLTFWTAPNQTAHATPEQRDRKLSKYSHPNRSSNLRQQCHPLQRLMTCQEQEEKTPTMTRSVHSPSHPAIPIEPPPPIFSGVSRPLVRQQSRRYSTTPSNERSIREKLSPTASSAAAGRRSRCRCSTRESRRSDRRSERSAT